MKLFNAIAAAAVIGGSLIAPNPSEAFWGRKLTWKELTSNPYLSEKEQRKIYNSNGWSFYQKTNQMIWFSKLFDCQGNTCLYFTKVIEDNGKGVQLHRVNCLTGTSQNLSLGGGVSLPNLEGKKKYC